MTAEHIFLSLFAIFFGGMLWLQWRTRRSTQALAGRPVPEAISQELQHPDGSLLFFHHPRCGPCRSMLPVIEALAADHPGRVQIIDISQQGELAVALGIRATPTTLWIQGGHIQQALLGATSGKQLEKLLTAS